MSSGLLGFYYTPCMSRALLLTHYYLVMREQQQTDSTGGHVLGPDAQAQVALQHFLSPSPSLTRASILILYICVLRTISRTLSVVGGLGSVLLLLPTLASAMATATAAVVVQVAAVVVGLAWALRYCGSVCTWRFFSRLFLARKYVETVACLRSHAHANRSYASPNPSTVGTQGAYYAFLVLKGSLPSPSPRCLIHVLLHPIPPLWPHLITTRGE